ncbi:hypothetical protein [Sphingomonas pituitosa]|uniref:hypothetical protein n=1 Tax=Sphingomonas pituitosa TaxID=99597 RepID=UPI0008300599|nr:hypothetical protein [Sphingomonas pituitosa]
MLLGMLGWITPFLIVSSYALLLVAAQILGAQLNFIGFMALVLGWFAVANWSTWSFTRPSVACAVTGISIVCLVSAPVNAIFVGCYVFGQCP